MYAVPAGDLDHDGRPDVAAVVSPTSLLPLFGSGGGQLEFGSAGAFAQAGTFSRSGAAVADFNADGHPDVAASLGSGSISLGHSGFRSVAVMLGDGAGGFTIASRVDPGGEAPEGLAAADLNGDGHEDVAVANFATDNVSILLGDGAGGLAPAPGSPVAAGDGAIAVAAADLDDDGDRDLAVVNWNAETISTLLGDGAGGFAAAPGAPVAVGRGVPASIAVGDFDEDGDADLTAAGFAAPSGVAVLLGNGAGDFAHAPGSPHGDGNVGSWGVGVGDFDGDGNQDVASTNHEANSISVRLGDGTGGLAAPSTHSVVTGQSLPLSDCPREGLFPITCKPRSISIADFDGDGTDDVVAGNWNAFSVSVLLNTSNSPPVAHDDEYATDEDVPLTVSAPGVLDNDSDPDDDALRAVLASGPLHGTLHLNTDGSFTYTPETDFSGTDSFSYRAGDGGANSNLATVAITVRPVNDPPLASDDQYSTDEDVPFGVPAPGVLANDADPDGDALTAVSGPAHGRLRLDADGSFTYTPEPNFSGTDAFNYVNTDGTLVSNVATVSITVRPVNDGPLARDDQYATHEDTPLTVIAPGVLGNDADPEGDPLGELTVVTGPAHGTLNLDPDGSFNYTPDENFSGNDSFRYEVSDGTATSEVATVSIGVEPVNDAPLAHDDPYATDEDARLVVQAPGVLGNDADPDGDALTAVPGSAPAHGTLDFNADGSFIYTPGPNFSGSDSFRYRASDQTDQSNLATVTIAVRPVNDAPVARDDEESTDEDMPLSVPAPGVLGNDTDAEGTPRAILVSEPAHGVVNLDADGSYTYEPAHNFSGDDSFSYRASDGAAQSNLATVTIIVRPVNDAPVAHDDPYATDEDARLIVQAPGVLANDADPDGDAVTAVLASAPAHGTLDFNDDGSFVYTPAPDYSGSDSFRYRAGDEADQSNLATVTITVRPVDDIIFASARTGGGDIYSVDPSGGAPTRLTSSPGIDWQPVWSPDRTRIAFTSTRAGGLEIYTMDADGGNVTRLTNSRAIDTAPAWSPDGSKIAFSSGPVGGNSDIYLMNAANGANVRRLTSHPAWDGSPAWSPNGTRIAFSSGRTGGADIYSMPAAPGSAQTRLTTSPGADEEPAWFGSTIAFTTNRHGDYEIYSMHQSGTAQTRRMNQPGHDISPAWSPDGTKLAFVTSRHGGQNYEIYTMNVDGTGQTRLTNHPALDMMPDW